MSFMILKWSCVVVLGASVIISLVLIWRSNLPMGAPGSSGGQLIVSEIGAAFSLFFGMASLAILFFEKNQSTAMTRGWVGATVTWIFLGFAIISYRLALRRIRSI